MPSGVYPHRRGPHGPYNKVDPQVRFWSRVDPCRTDGCAVWLGPLGSTGYGSFSWDGYVGPAFHFLVGGPVPGMEWDHLCRNRLCVNPEHLEPVTGSVNALRRWRDNPVARPRKTHALAGICWIQRYIVGRKAIAVGSARALIRGRICG